MLSFINIRLVILGVYIYSDDIKIYNVILPCKGKIFPGKGFLWGSLHKKKKGLEVFWWDRFYKMCYYTRRNVKAGAVPVV